MNKKSLILLIFACLFATVALVFLSLECVCMGVAIDAVVIKGKTLGDALGGIFLYIYGILTAIVTCLASAAALPFDIILMKVDGKKWYSKAILIFVIIAIILAIILAIALPVLGEISNHINAKGSSSSSI